MTTRSSRPLLVVAAVLVALLVAPVAPLAAKPKASPPADDGVLTYVALGDSYASGPLVPLQEPNGCLRSTNDYAKLLAAALAATLRDATCSGADTKDIREPQGTTPEPNPPQLDRLDPSVDLVTLQIGGNDIGFGGIAETCARAGVEQRPCRDEYVAEDGSDELRARIAETGPKVVQVLADIAARSPRADVLVLGYPGIFHVEGPAACPAMLVGDEDAEYLRGIQLALNDMVRTAAETAGATYVDVYRPSAGKTACDLPVLRWVEPIVPVNAAAPVHPNLTGMLGIADLLEPVATDALATPPAPKGKKPKR